MGLEGRFPYRLPWVFYTSLPTFPLHLRFRAHAVGIIAARLMLRP